MPNFRLATWNVNSIRIRLELLKKLVETKSPDILCLQEIKAKPEDFPYAEVKALGYPYIALYSQAGYNGVGIFSKYPFDEEQPLNWVGKKDARHIQVRIFGDVVINNIYIPAGGDIPDPIENISFAHKLTFMDDISEYWEQRKSDLSNKKIITCGDFNVAPKENDVWNHKQLLKIVSHTPVEVERLKRLKESLNYIDIARAVHPDSEKIFSWWSYRNPNWATNNKGRRLDHIWVTQPLKDSFKNYEIVKEARSWERPSDHVPVIVDFAI